MAESSSLSKEQDTRQNQKQARLLEMMKQDSSLREMVSSPRMQQFIVEMLESEKKFDQQRQNQPNFGNRGGGGGNRHHNQQQWQNRRNGNNRHNQQQPQNLSQTGPLSPLEIKTIESMSSEEQTFLRHLLQVVLSD